MHSRKAVLVVDDDPGITLLLKSDIMRRFRDRFECEIANNGEQALALVEEMVADGICLILIVSDWLMPGMNGDEFLLAVHRRYPAVRAILISGYADPEAVEAVKAKVSLQAFLGKPWDKEVLYGEIERSLLGISEQSLS